MWVSVLPTLHLKPYPNKTGGRRKTNSTRHDTSQSTNSSLISIWQLLCAETTNCDHDRVPQPQDLHGLARSICPEDSAVALSHDPRSQHYHSPGQTALFRAMIPWATEMSKGLFTPNKGFFFFPLSKAFNQNSFRWLFSRDRLKEEEWVFTFS